MQTNKPKIPPSAFLYTPKTAQTPRPCALPPPPHLHLTLPTCVLPPSSARLWQVLFSLSEAPPQTSPLLNFYFFSNQSAEHCLSLNPNCVNHVFHFLYFKMP